jgi:hypothetical protein
MKRPSVLVLVSCQAGLVLNAACSSGQNPHAGTSYSKWERMNSGTSAFLSDVWGTSSTNVYAVGRDESDKGVILHYDGQSWQPMVLPANTPVLYNIWGRSETEIYATVFGQPPLRFDGQAWSPDTRIRLSGDKIWGYPPEDAIYVADSHTVEYIKGASRSYVVNSGWLLDITGTCTGNAYLSGHHGYVARVRDGVVVADLHGEAEYPFHELWAAADDSLYASIPGTESATEPQYMAHYNGSTWSYESYPAKALMFAVWGTSDFNVFAGGSGGVIIRYDGGSWERMDTGGSDDEDIYGIWGTPDGSSVFAVGEAGVILHNSSAPDSHASSAGVCAAGPTTPLLQRCWCSCQCENCIVTTEGQLVGTDKNCNNLCPDLCASGKPSLDCGFWQGSVLNEQCVPEPNP